MKSSTAAYRAGALLLFASVVLHDDTYTIQPKRWRFDRFITNRQLPVQVDCRFREVSGMPIRAELVTEENLSAKLHHRAYEAIASSSNGTLRYQIGVPGTFAVVIVNDDPSHPAQASLRTALDLSPIQNGFPGALTTRRKFTVMALSFIGFFAIVAFSARKVLDAIQKGRGSGT